MINAMIRIILSGAVLPLVYFTVTVITAISIMTKGSIAVGASALAASAFSYVGVAGFIGNRAGCGNLHRPISGVSA